MRERARGARREAANRRRLASFGQQSSIGSGGRELGISASQATGTRTILAMRLKWGNTADSTAGITQAQMQALVTAIRDFWGNQSYGLMTAAFANNAQCVYELSYIPNGASNASDAGAIATAADAAAAAHPDPACRFTASSFTHTMYLHPGGTTGYAGLGEVPGR